MRRLLGPESRLRDLLPSYEPRPSQMQMAGAVLAALEDERHLMVEAGTGTGKTLAYLAAAAVSGRRVIVSTATRALQEQIAHHDLPMLERALGAQTNVAFMKGVSNYVCKRRLSEALATEHAPGLGVIAEWVQRSREGDVAELRELPEDSYAWSLVRSSADTRIGPPCQYFDDCFVTQMRRRAESAQIIVVNHHLFFADLALRAKPGGEYAAVLPPFDAVIFDEAHQLEDIATDFFGARLSARSLAVLARDTARALQTGGASPMDTRRAAENVEIRAENFFALLRRPGQRGAERMLVRNLGWGPSHQEACVALDSALGALQQRLASRDDEPSRAGTRRVGQALSALRTIFRHDPHGAPEDIDAQVVWVEASERNVSVGASPIDMGPTFRDWLFSRIPSVVCTSATLTVDGLFDYQRARLGSPSVTELSLASPFDYERNAMLFLESELPEPNHPEYADLAAARALSLIELTGGGAFVLSTSLRGMHAMARALEKRCAQPVLVQGEAPKQALLDAFREHGSAVLVATMSFWEGVDVPGRALRLVIIDRIPFAVPTDPVVVARSRRVEDEGGSAFSDYSLPEAAITLKQGFGRLIRGTDDRGVVAILDRRITKKGYGKKLVRSLPPARTATTLDEVRAFVSSWDAQR